MERERLKRENEIMEADRRCKMEEEAKTRLAVVAEQARLKAARVAEVETHVKLLAKEERKNTEQKIEAEKPAQKASEAVAMEESSYDSDEFDADFAGSDATSSPPAPLALRRAAARGAPP